MPQRLNEADICIEIVNQLNIGYAVVDNQLIIQQINSTLYQWVAIATPELVGKPLTEAFWELVGQEDIIQKLLDGDHNTNDVPIALTKIQRGLESGQEQYFDLQLELLSQKEQTLLLVATDVTAYSHLEQRLTQQQRDLGLEVTYRKKAEAEIRQAKIEAETASRAKSAFLTNMSHELRTPIHAIMGFANLINQDKANLSPQQQQQLQIISENSEYLLALVNQVLELTKLEAEGRITPEIYQQQSTLIQRLFQDDENQTDALTEKQSTLNKDDNSELRIQLEQLPHDFRTQLKTAVQQSDMDLIETLIVDLYQINPAVAQQLAVLADQFLYDELLTLL